MRRRQKVKLGVGQTEKFVEQGTVPLTSVTHEVNSDLPASKARRKLKSAFPKAPS